MSVRQLEGPSRQARSGEATSLVVFLHGYGADGADLFGLAEPLSNVLPNAAFAAPNAPEPCRVNPMGRQWFPISWIDGSSEAAMRAGFERAQSDLDVYLDGALAALGLGGGDLALVGFSQGTMMSLQVGPRRAPGPAAIVGFSGRVADEEALKAGVVSAPPVLLVHGDQDEVIPVDNLETARATLSAAGMQVRWRVSRGVGHGIGPDGLELAAAFLNETLTAKDAAPGEA